MSLPRDREFKYASGKDHGANRILAHMAVYRMNPRQRVEAYRQAFLVACNHHADGEAYALLELLNEASEEAELVSLPLAESDSERYKLERQGRETAKHAVRAFLMEQYFLLPDVREVKRFGAGGEKAVAEPTLLKTKGAILRLVADQWDVDSREAASIDAFRFLIAVLRPLPESYGYRAGESQWEMSARGRRTTTEESELVLKLFEDPYRIGNDDREAVLWWIREPHVPSNIALALYGAYIGRGSVSDCLAEAALLEAMRSFDHKKRSPAALRALSESAVEARRLDELAQALVKHMQSGSPWMANKIGETDFVPGEISYQLKMRQGSLTHTSEIHVDVLLPEDCLGVLAHDVRGRVRRHIERFCEDAADVSVGYQLRGEGIPDGETAILYQGRGKREE